MSGSPFQPHNERFFLKITAVGSYPQNLISQALLKKKGRKRRIEKKSFVRLSRRNQQRVTGTRLKIHARGNRALKRNIISLFITKRTKHLTRVVNRMSASHRPADGRARFGREAEVGQELGACCVLVYSETSSISALHADGPRRGRCILCTRARSSGQVLCVATIKESISVINYYGGAHHQHRSVVSPSSVLLCDLCWSWYLRRDLGARQANLRILLKWYTANNRGGRCSSRDLLRPVFVVIPHAARKSPVDALLLTAAVAGRAARFTDSLVNKKALRTGPQEIRQIWNRRFVSHEEQRSRYRCLLL